MTNAFEIKSAHAANRLKSAESARTEIERADGNLDVEAWVQADEEVKAASKAWATAVNQMVEAHLAGLR